MLLTPARDTPAISTKKRDPLTKAGGPKWMGLRVNMVRAAQHQVLLTSYSSVSIYTITREAPHQSWWVHAAGERGMTCLAARVEAGDAVV